MPEQLVLYTLYGLYSGASQHILQLYSIMHIAWGGRGGSSMPDQ